MQTTRFREDAREIIHDAVGGGDDDLRDLLRLGRDGRDQQAHRRPEPAPAGGSRRALRARAAHPRERAPGRVHRPVRAPLERAAVARVDRRRRRHRRGRRRPHRSRSASSAQLVEYAERPLKIGSFSAASNVTGIGSDTLAISTLLHEHGALSFWDFAAAAPYVQIEMKPEGGRAARLQGRGLPLAAQVHRRPGHARRARREAAPPQEPRARRCRAAAPSRTSTPGSPRLRRATRCTARKAARRRSSSRSAPGSSSSSRRPSASRRSASARRRSSTARSTRGARTRTSASSATRRRGGSRSCRSWCATRRAHLHHNFVVALLNDLFGIQARGGCSCAGPYGHRLLGIDSTHHRTASSARSSPAARASSPAGCASTSTTSSRRRSSSSSSTRSTSSPTHGWKLLPHYRFDLATGAVAPARGAPRRRRCGSRSLVPHGQARVPLAPRDRARVGAAELPRRRRAHRRGRRARLQDDAGARRHAAPRGRGSLAVVPAPRGGLVRAARRRTEDALRAPVRLRSRLDHHQPPPSVSRTDVITGLVGKLN